MWEILKRTLSIFDGMLQNKRASELKADGARKAELERRDELDKVKERADEQRKKTAGADGRDVAGGL